MNFDRNKAVADRLKTLRLNSNFTQKELGYILGVTQQNIQMWESGKRVPGLEQIAAYCEYFRVRASEIVDIYLPVNTGADNLENIIENFKIQLSKVFPTQIPVYSQAVFGNPKFPDQKPFDYIYWSNQRIKGRRLYVLQVQTPNMYPDIQVNDRIIVDPDLSIDDGIAVIVSNEKRANFDNQIGASVVRVRRSSNGYVYNNNFTTKEEPLKKEHYQGMAIQTLRGLKVEGLSQSYEQIEEKIIENRSKNASR